MLIPLKNNLGGNMNQDISKALLKPDLVYNSENFRVVTTNGATTLSRTNIRGNKFDSVIPDINSVSKIEINTEYLSHLSLGSIYSIVVNIDGTNLPAYQFTYTSLADLLTGLTSHINSSFGTTVATSYTDSIHISSSAVTNVSITSFTFVSGGTGLVNYNQYLTLPRVAGANTLNSWVATDSGGAGIAYSNHPTFVNIGGLMQWVANTEISNGPASWHEVTQTIPKTLPTGNYTINLKYKTGAIQNTTAYISLDLGGVTPMSYALSGGQDYSGVAGASVRTITTPITPTNNDITIRLDFTPTSITPPPTTAAVVWIVGVDLYGPGMYSQIFNVTNNYISGVASAQIIGWVTLRDDIYLFTTSCTDPDPGGVDPISNGQIWKFTYDRTADPNVNINSTLTLIYNSELNFSTQHPILNLGRVEARYENENIQKIYWTDNFNPPRYINVADPNVASLAPSQLLLTPAIDFDVLNLTGIVKGGNLKSGMYQYAYRLKRNNGAETRFSMPSILVPLTVQDESTTNWIDYYAVDAGVTVDKSIQLEVSNIDTNFDRIEIAFIYYGTKNTAPEIKVISDNVITGSTMTFLHTGEEDSDYPISIDELTAFSTNIVRAKAMATKNNILFLSNVRTNTFDVDYDSRAYRFPLNSTTTTLYDAQGTPYTLTKSGNTWQITAINGSAVTPYDVPETFDAIQDYGNQSPLSTNNLLYKPGSVSASTLTNLGGQGPNVSYEFSSFPILADEKQIGNSFSPGSYNGAPYRNIITKTNTIISLGDRDHTNGNFYDCFVSPFYAPLMAGYQRDEMYRFAVVFFDDLGNPSFPKWIADIRVPHVYMPNGTAKHQRFLAYPLATYDSTNVKAYTNQMYLKFSLSNIPTEATGFQIVVVPRTDNDKHIVGQGVFNFAQKDYSSVISGTAFYLSHDSATGLGGSNYYPVNLRSDSLLWHNVGSIKSPDFDFRGFPGFQTGDSIDFVGILGTNQNSFVYGQDCGNALDGNNIPCEDVAWIISKYYSHIDTANSPYCIKDSAADGPIYPVHESFLAGHSSTFGAYNPSTLLVYNTNARVGNFSPSNSNTGFVTRYSTGSNRAAIIFGGNKPTSGNLNGSVDFLTTTFGGRGYADLDSWTSQGGSSLYKYIVNYNRTLNAQYNGSSYAQRSTNTYIPVSNYFKVTGVNMPNLLIAGGDTYTQVYDTIMDFPDWKRRVGDSAISVMDPSGAGGGDNSILIGEAGGITLCVPLESTINTELRGKDILPAAIPNYSDPFGQGSSGAVDTVESFEATTCDLFSWNPYYMVHVAKPLNYQNINEYDTRTYKSETKTNSEDIDSWTTFLPEAYKDVDSKYGPINNLIVFKDKLFYFQDRGFGLFQVNAQQLIQDATSTSELVLGTSGVLERYDYISTIVGSKNQSGFAVSDDSIVFIDVLGRKIFKFSAQGTEPLSDIKGLNAFLYRKLDGLIQSTDNPITDNGFVCTYDHRYNEFLISMLDKNEEVGTGDYFTIAYSALTDGFTSFYSYYPRLYINDRLNIFTVPGNTNSDGGYIYLQDYGQYGKFYNKPVVDSKVSFIVNQESDKEKILTNFEFVTESYQDIGIYDIYNPMSVPVPYDFFKSIRVSNTYQNTDYILCSETAKRRKTLWNVLVPGNRVLYNNKDIVDIFDTSNISQTRLALTQRMKDRWFLVDAVYDNSNNYRFVVTNSNSLVMLNTR
jgi:hypothetical protein